MRSRNALATYRNEYLCVYVANIRGESYRLRERKASCTN